MARRHRGSKELAWGLVVAGGLVVISPTWAWEVVDAWIAGGGDPGEFRTPLDLALDDDGNLYVVDTGNNRIQVLSPTGEYLRQWGRYGSGVGEFDQPRCISISDGVVYVGEGGPNCRIQRFSLTGSPQGRWGTCAFGQGSLQAARGINVTDGVAHVASDNWVNRFNAANGALLNGLAVGFVPMDVWVAADGTIWVCFEQSLVRHYGPDWQLLHSWSTLVQGDRSSLPRSIAVDDRGNVLLVETGEASDFLKEFSPEGALRARVELRFDNDIYEGRGLAIIGDTIFIVSEFPDGILTLVRKLVPVEDTTWGAIKARYQN
jgi:DNA-binding beta-propeller fold protein YncE